MIQLFVFIGAMLSLQMSCNYSFSGAKVDENLKTITINYFTNQATLGSASLGQVFTETLKDKFISQTKLNLADQKGDLELSGAITGYNISFRSPNAGETSALNRLTVTVKVDCKNKHDEKQNWSQNFTRFAEYESTQNLTDIEEQLITDINQQLVDDIFNKTLVNW